MQMLRNPSLCGAARLLVMRPHPNNFDNVLSAVNLVDNAVLGEYKSPPSQMTRVTSDRMKYNLQP